MVQGGEDKSGKRAAELPCCQNSSNSFGTPVYLILNVATRIGTNALQNR